MYKTKPIADGAVARLCSGACLPWSGGGGVAKAATYPAGVYVVVDPADTTSEVADFDNADLTPLYGPSSCTGGDGTPLVCSGGIGGVTLSVEWFDFETTSTSGSTTSVVLDPSGHVVSMMGDINSIESAYDLTHSGSFSFLMTLALKTGKYTAYNVLDMYTAAGGDPTGTQPGVGASDVAFNGIEGNCGYTYSGGLPNDNAPNFDATSGFPEQCVLSTAAGGKYECTPMPRIFGADTPSTTSNTYYTTAHTRTLQNLANLVTGVTGYGNSLYPHHFQALKLAGISNSDEEIVVSGKPAIKMPSYMCGTDTCYHTCGYSTATDAEEVWTKQTDGSGNPIYETTSMEGTWYNLVRGATGVTSSYGDSISYVIDTLGDSQFPPVQPKGCSTDCIYTAQYDSIIPTVTTGEMEHIIQESVSNSLVASDNLSIQNETLEYDQPDNDLSVEPNYASGEVPCALNALLGTSIGYQSAGAESNKSYYLRGITNGAAYGAQYIELDPTQLLAFLTDTTDTVDMYGYINYGTSVAENQNLLSIAMHLAQVSMATNAANSSLMTLCPLPESGGVSQSWDYPYNDDESRGAMNRLLWGNDIPL